MAKWPSSKRINKTGPVRLLHIATFICRARHRSATSGRHKLVSAAALTPAAASEDSPAGPALHPWSGAFACWYDKQRKTLCRRPADPGKRRGDRQTGYGRRVRAARPSHCLIEGRAIFVRCALASDLLGNGVVREAARTQLRAPKAPPPSHTVEGLGPNLGSLDRVEAARRTQSCAGRRGLLPHPGQSRANRPGSGLRHLPPFMHIPSCPHSEGSPCRVIMRLTHE